MSFERIKSEGFFESGSFELTKSRYGFPTKLWTSIDMSRSNTIKTKDTEESFNLERLIMRHKSLKLDTPSSAFNRDILDKHIQPFTMQFNNIEIEREFLQQHALNQRRVIYMGYIAVTVGGALLITFSVLIRDLKHRLCLKASGQCREACESMFTVAKVQLDSMLTFVVPFCGFVTLVGIAAHTYIHRNAKIENKAWSLLAVGITYTTMISGFAFLAGVFNQVDSFWMIRLFGGYNLLLLIAISFSGLLFWPIVLLYVICSCFYYGASIPVMVDDFHQIIGDLDTMSEIEPTFEIVLFSGTAALNFICNILMVIGAYYYERAFRRDFLEGFMIQHQQDKVIGQTKKREQILKDALENILPPTLVNALHAQSYQLSSCSDLKSLSHEHDGVSILYADIVDFTMFAKQVDSRIVMNYLNELFQRFDGMCDSLNVYKVETIGDCYVAAVGIVTGKVLTQPVHALEGKREVKRSPSYLFNGRLGNFSEDTEMLDASQQNTEDMVNFAKVMVREARKILKPDLEIPTLLRIGIHTGPCMSGVVGTKKMRFSLFGETVNIASWLEQNGSCNAIHASDVVAGLVPHETWIATKECCEKYKIQSYMLSL